MSTIQATNLKNALSTTNNAVMTASGDLTNAAGISYMGGSKNLLINGAMQVSQRSTSSTGNTSGGYLTADRWETSIVSIGTWTQDIQNDAPIGSGFRRSLRMLCTSADSSPASTDVLNIIQKLEGQDLQRILKGTPSAQQLTISFWVKSNVTGTYACELNDFDNSRFYSANYTINTSATWEKKVITFPADNVGVLDNDSSLSFYVRMWLAAGSAYTSGSAVTTWSDLNTNLTKLAPSQVNLAAATNNYWQMTGMQLEIGPVATSFEFEPYETTLRKCQRYYWRISPGVTGYPAYPALGAATSTTAGQVILINPVPMRTPASSVESSNIHISYWTSGVAATSVTIDTANSTTNATKVSLAAASGLTAGQNIFLAGNNNASTYLGVIAEL